MCKLFSVVMEKMSTARPTIEHSSDSSMHTGSYSVTYHVALVAFPDRRRVAINTFTWLAAQAIQHDAFPFCQGLEDFGLYFVGTTIYWSRLVDFDSAGNVAVGDSKLNSTFGNGAVQFIIHTGSASKSKGGGVLHRVE
jgi:hypothetical protein